MSQVHRTNCRREQGAATLLPNLGDKEVHEHYHRRRATVPQSSSSEPREDSSRGHAIARGKKIAEVQWTAGLKADFRDHRDILNAISIGTRSSRERARWTTCNSLILDNYLTQKVFHGVHGGAATCEGTVAQEL